MKNTLFTARLRTVTVHIVDRHQMDDIDVTGIGKTPAKAFRDAVRKFSTTLSPVFQPLGHAIGYDICPIRLDLTNVNRRTTTTVRFRNDNHPVEF